MLQTCSQSSERESKKLWIGFLADREMRGRLACADKALCPKQAVDFFSASGEAKPRAAHFHIFKSRYLDLTKIGRSAILCHASF